LLIEEALGSQPSAFSHPDTWLGVLTFTIFVEDKGRRSRFFVATLLGVTIVNGDGGHADYRTPMIIAKG